MDQSADVANCALMEFYLKLPIGSIKIIARENYLLRFGVVRARAEVPRAASRSGSPSFFTLAYL